MSKRSITRGIAAAAIVAAMGLGAPAQAVVYNETLNFNPNSVQCGFFVRSGICVQSRNFSTPINTQVGDQIHVRVNMTAPLQTPASSTQSGIYVNAYNATSTLGPGTFGPVQTGYQLVAEGLQVAPGDPTPFSGAGIANRSNDYIGFMGNFGVASEGFSVTGLDAYLNVLAADPLPTVGISAGYFWTLDEVPKTFSDLPGGSEGSPVILPTGLIGQINGSIGGDVTEQFYNFQWGGGLFQTRASILGGMAGTEFTFRLSGAGGYKETLLLNDGNSFNRLFTDNLAAGSYTIGLLVGDIPDPQFRFDFLTPIGVAAVPEPQTWAMLIMGFGALGAVLRRRRLALI